jgi:hypothetical protein
VHIDLTEISEIELPGVTITNDTEYYDFRS